VGPWSIRAWMEVSYWHRLAVRGGAAIWSDSRGTSTVLARRAGRGNLTQTDIDPEVLGSGPFPVKHL
jgi:hypothetical protein